MDHGIKAAELFLSGYNCAQAVAVAFCDVTGMREVCGAVSGMLLVLGTLEGYDTPGDDVSKKRLYSQVQALAKQFREANGSIICREILKNPPSDPNPTPRTAAFYAQRPCAKMVMTAARLLDSFLAEE